MRRDLKGAKMMETTVVVVVIMFTMRTMIILSTVLLCSGVESNHQGLTLVLSEVSL